MSRRTLWLAGLLAALAAGAAETGGEVAQSACKPGGFTLIRFSSVDAAPKSDANFRVFLDAASYQGNGFDAALRSAMATWNAAGSRWRYNLAGYTSSGATQQDGQMFVLSGGSSFPQGVLASTLVSAVAATGEIVDADLFLNPAANFSTTGAAGAIDFESVALHELGHGFGLDHNDACGVGSTVMHSTIASGIQRRSLFPPETAGVQYLYPGSGGGGGGGSGNTVTASPSTLVFAATAGAAEPPAQSLAILGSFGTPWTAAVLAGNWLALGAGSGVTPAVLSVSARTAGMLPGTYVGRVKVLAPGNSQEVAVTLNLDAPPAPALQVTPGAVSFAASLADPPPGPKTLGLTGTAGAAWTASSTTSEGGSWLRVTPGAGTLPALLSVAVDTAGLSAQSYRGTITITSGALARQVEVLLSLSAQAVLQVDPAEVNLTASAGASVPVCAPFRVAAGSTALDWSALPGAGWLALLPSAGRTPATANLCATAANLPEGNYTATVRISGAASNSPQSLTVNLAVAGVVAVKDGGIVNAASFAPGRAIAAGEILSLFGNNLASQTAWAAGFPLPTELANTRVQIGGVPARLIYVSPGQINLVTPSLLENLAGSATVLTVFQGSRTSPQARVNVAPQAPGIFTLLGTGSGAGAITHADGAPVSRAAPARPGEALSIYLTGLGPLSPPVADGAAAPADPLARATGNVTVAVDGQNAPVLYAGAAPGFAGLQVVVATFPETLVRRFPEIVVQAGGTSSNRVTAGGPSLLDAAPAVLRGGVDNVVTLRGLNLPPAPAVLLGSTEIPAALSGGEFWQTLQVTIPAAAIGSAGTIELRVIDTQARGEAASNLVTLPVQR